MRSLILVAGAMLSLSACGSKSDATNTEANSMAADNMMDQNATMDANMSGGMDANATGGMDANMTTNAATENELMAKDMNTNAPDTNLANGM